MLVKSIFFQDMLLRMPGVNSKNYRLLMNKVQDLAELCTLNEEELTRIMGNSHHAKLLWEFLHSKHKPSDSAVSGKPSKTETVAKKSYKRKR